jgi:alpha-galactosidase
VGKRDEQLIRVDAGGWGLTWAADGDGTLRQVGLGPSGHTVVMDVDARWYPVAFPTWGGGDPYRPAALRVTHADGMTTTRLVLDGVYREPVDGGEHVVVALADELQPLRVELHLRTHGSGVLEQWVELLHGQPGPVRLHDHDSIAPFLLIDEPAELVQFGGSGWADEWRWTTQSLSTGTLSLASFGGLQPHLQRSPVALLSPSGPSTEDDGEVLGLSVAWGGNTRIDLDVRPNADPTAARQLRLRAGANPVGAEYVLDPGVRFVTPTVAWTWSAAGRREVTRRFHDWTRGRVMRDPERLRPLVVNNWEATFFDFDEARLLDLIRRAGELDADVFLLDDGWFGTTHPRDDDTTSLGDWEHDPKKLPRGLAPLPAAAAEAGLRFGIWVEPEMVNPVSDLHDAHPEWVLRDRREPRLHRHQLALDPLLPEVREFEVDVVDRTLASAPGTTYVKWDANRPITDPGSSALAPDRQGNLWVDHVHATWQVMAEVARRHPDVELMLCASGGGRTDHGTLRWFHEFWTSDNTDPVTRVRMQWACSLVFPPAVIAAHVTRWGERPLELGCAVALSGRFGIDLDLRKLRGDERSILRRAVALARRTQDLVQQGELVRLVSPVEGSDTTRAALAHLDADRDRAVVFGYQLEAPQGPGPRLRLTDLAGARGYRVRATDLRADTPLLDEVRSGDSLAEEGLAWPLEQPCTAVIWELDADPGDPAPARP